MLPGNVYFPHHVEKQCRMFQHWEIFCMRRRYFKNSLLLLFVFFFLHPLRIVQPPWMPHPATPLKMSHPDPIHGRTSTRSEVYQVG